MTRRARQLTVVLLCLLAAQFVLGMTANFCARMPPTLPEVRGNVDARLAAPPGGHSCTARPRSSSTSQAIAVTARAEPDDLVLVAARDTETSPRS